MLESTMKKAKLQSDLGDMWDMYLQQKSEN